MNNAKTKIQNLSLKKWGENKGIGTIALHTGAGKTKVGVDAAGKMFDNNNIKSCLILVPSTNLRDNEWINEFKKWGYEQWLPHITIECVQTAYKWEEAQYDLIILDEIHAYLSPEFRSVFNFSYKYLLGLTATPPKKSADPQKKEYWEIYNKECPTVYELSIQDGVKLGTASAYKIYNLAVPLTKKENQKYRLWDKKFRDSSATLSRWKSTMKLSESIFELATQLSKEKGHTLQNSSQQFWMAMSKRKQICYTSTNKLEYTKMILEKFPDKNTLVFGKSTDMVDELYEWAEEKGIKSAKYHSKMKTKERSLHLQRASEDSTSLVISAEALEQGYNLPKLNLGISMASVSTERRFQQSLGRQLRLAEDGKQAIFINLYAENTQEEKWVRSKIEGFRSEWILSLNEIV